MAKKQFTHPAQSAQKSTITNQKWCGPNLGECEAAFVAAFVEPSRAIPQAWYTINTGVYTASVDRESGEISYREA